MRSTVEPLCGYLSEDFVFLTRFPSNRRFFKEIVAYIKNFFAWQCYEQAWEITTTTIGLYWNRLLTCITLFGRFARQTRCQSWSNGNAINAWAPCERTEHYWPTTPNIAGCYMLRPFTHPVACCYMLLCVVGQSLKPVKLFSQQLPTFLLFRDRWSVHKNVGSPFAQLFQHCWGHARS